MSSKPAKNKYDDVSNKGIETEEPINFTNIVIPFNKFGSMRNPSYIYNGPEKISFKERHPLYQTILRNEFTEGIRKS